MIKLRHQQPSLWHRESGREYRGAVVLGCFWWTSCWRTSNCWTGSKRKGDAIPEPHSWQMQTPAEVVLRLLLLKHLRNWDYDMLEHEVRANLVYRAFTRIGNKSAGRQDLGTTGRMIGPAVIEQLHRRVVELAQERGVTRGRKLRVDTTVVESNIHYPTDSSLLGRDAGADAHHEEDRVEVGRSERQGADRMRSIRKRVLAIALSARLWAVGRERRSGSNGTPAVHAKSDESGADCPGRSEAGAASSAHSGEGSGAIAGGHVGAGSTSDETDQEFNSQATRDAGKDRERVRTAPESFARGKRASPRVSASWSRSRKRNTNRDPL